MLFGQKHSFIETIIQRQHGAYMIVFYYLIIRNKYIEMSNSSIFSRYW